MILQLLLAAAAPAAAPQLVFPVQCEVGRTCEIQTYMDRDPAAGAARDYRCGPLTNDDHRGVDFRLPSMTAQRAGVAVLAAADGRVARVRDGLADTSVRATGAAAVESVECGNAAVIDHGNGWETQYCHMARGSVRVKPGDAVKAGEPIGRIGLSGQTEFPHLHFMVRNAQGLVDPFAPDPGTAGACGSGRSLWTRAAAAAMPYKERAVLNTGFAAGALTMQVVEDESFPKVNPEAPAMLAYARAIGLRAGDEQELVLTGPGGAVLQRNRANPLARNQAQNLIYTGVRRPPSGWAKGAYEATYTVRNQGQVVLTRRFSFTH